MAAQVVRWAIPASMRAAVQRQCEVEGRTENEWVADALAAWAADSDLVRANPAAFYDLPILPADTVTDIERLYATDRRLLNLFLYVLHECRWALSPVCETVLWETRAEVASRVAKGRRMVADSNNPDLPYLLASLPLIPPSPDPGPVVSLDMVAPRYVVDARVHGRVLAKVDVLGWGRSRALTTAISEKLWKRGLDSNGAARPTVGAI